MDTQNYSKKTSRFIILIPHRDTLALFYGYRKKLFSTGFYGAHSFPAAAPLARVRGSFSRDELKSLARNIREHAGVDDGGKNEKIRSTGLCTVSYNGIAGQAASQENSDEKSAEFEKMHFFGLSLAMPSGEGIFPNSTKSKVLGYFTPPVLCAALVHSGSEPVMDPAGTMIPGYDPGEVKTSVPDRSFEQAPALSFRAAALANLAIRPLAEGAQGYSMEWRISPLVWLPAEGKKG